VFVFAAVIGFARARVLVAKVLANTTASGNHA
jgi:hypothetical protein